MLKSLGIIETKGLPAAFEAADAASKASNIDLIGYEKTKGGGWITVKVVGDLGSVQAGINAAVAGVTRMNCMISYSIITRPVEEIDRMIRNAETRGYDEQSARTN